MARCEVGFSVCHNIRYCTYANDHFYDLNFGFGYVEIIRVGFSSFFQVIVFRERRDLNVLYVPIHAPIFGLILLMHVRKQREYKLVP